MTRLSNAILLATLQKVKAIVCIIRSLNISWSVEMLFLLRMQFSLCFHVPKDIHVHSQDMYETLLLLLVVL